MGSIAPEASMKSLLGDNYKVKPQVNKEVYFNVFWLNSVNSAEYAISVFNDLPKWVQDKIMLSDEWKAYAVCNYYIAPTIAVASPSRYQPATTNRFTTGITIPINSVG